jgi:hypothetical protein
VLDQDLKKHDPSFENIIGKLERVEKSKKPFKGKIIEKIIDRIKTID